MAKSKTTSAEEPDQQALAAAEAVSLDAMIEEAQRDYRAMVGRLAAGETLPEATIREAAGLAGKPLSLVSMHVDRLKQRLQAAQDLAGAGELDAEIEAAKKAMQAAEDVRNAVRAKAQKMVDDAQEAFSQASTRFDQAANRQLLIRQRAREVLEATADPAIERQAAGTAKGLGFAQLEADKAEQGHAGPVPIAPRFAGAIKRKAANQAATVKTLRDRKLHPTDGMDWS